MVDTRRVRTREEVHGANTEKARLEAKGYQGPDLLGGNVDIAGRVGRRSSHSRLISLGALAAWKIRSVEIKSAFLQADGFGREVYVRTPCDRNPRAVAVIGN